MADLDKALQIFSREGEEKLTQEKAGKISVPYVNLIGYPFTPDILSIIPKEQATAHQVISYYKTNDQVKVVSPNPENPTLVPFLRDLAQATNLKFYLYLCSPSSFRYALAQLEFVREAPKTLDRHIVSDEYIKAKFGGAQDLVSIGQKILQTPTTEILDIVFAGAIHLEASDIHLEPTETGARLRYRIDGILEDIASLQKETFKAIRNRIKYLSKLKLNITEEPQDGRFEIQIGSLDIDVRVSLLPGAWGEVIVCRLLNPSGAIISLEGLGFRADALKAIQEAVKKPNGAIFNTGPTGSGKTTTLYAFLRLAPGPRHFNGRGNQRQGNGRNGSAGIFDRAFSFNDAPHQLRAIVNTAASRYGRQTVSAVRFDKFNYRPKISQKNLHRLQKFSTSSNSKIFFERSAAESRSNRSGLSRLQRNRL